MNDLYSRQLRSFARNKVAVAGAVIFITIILMSIFAAQLAPMDPLVQDIEHRLSPPSSHFLLGTDDLGRDVLSRLLWGSHSSLIIGLGSIVFGLIWGSLMGMLAGYSGGKIESFIMRTVDVMMCFPAEILAIIIIVVLGQGLDKMVITIGLVMVPRFARLTYGSTLSLKKLEFIEAERAFGASTARILRAGIMPNILGEVMVMSSLWAATAIRVEANLSFLGMGVSPPTPTWGNMVREGLPHLSTAPWLAIFPGIAIMLIVLALNLLGDGLRDVLDPKL